MEYGGSLLTVKDVDVSKAFYVNVLEQKIVFDMGEHVTFEGGFSIQQDYSKLIGLSENDILQKAHNFQLYFEVTDLDNWNLQLKNISSIEFLHDIKEYAWGQRSIRLYDPDMHIIEVAESIESVIKRFLKQGLSVEETAERTMFPIDFVKKCL
ncbi:VOC family protein [Marinisporobacter balticus]|uniref:Catechol 2,3-dioxygenase-like lactoylglutathione lyase family enzyme n=1 Tax=Marinisporobacter balticus TaxID=2018667 RepID=A0A4V2S9R4_9FIRM|nr:VOC family protein [Marinisporobacter balticus]TCO68910.1 catechol 2,3-dioxygenase-like lactoylglutathione lyase family enzyme [Marinisporobacter balticus]